MSGVEMSRSLDRAVWSYLAHNLYCNIIFKVKINVSVSILVKNVRNVKVVQHFQTFVPHVAM